MRAALHPDFVFKTGTLHDARLGLNYVLTADAAWVLAELGRESRLSALGAFVARNKQLPPREAERAVYALCGQLAAYGGIIVTVAQANVFIRMRAWATWRTRHNASMVGFCKSVWRAYGLLCVLGVGLFAWGLFTLGAFSPLPLVVPVAVFVSCVLHELGHVLAARVVKVPAALLSNMGYMALLYKRPAPNAERFIAVCGALPVLFLCAVVAVATTLPALHILCIAIGAVQAISLLPICADGKSLWRRTRRSESLGRVKDRPVFGSKTKEVGGGI